MDGCRDGGMEGWTDGRTDAWTDGGMDGWRDGRMEGRRWTDGCCMSGEHVNPRALAVIPDARV